MILYVTICVYRSAICFFENELSEGVCNSISGSHSYVEQTCSTHISNYKNLLLAWAYCPTRVKFHVCYKIGYNATITNVN
jgi:hypothetical protein